MTNHPLKHLTKFLRAAFVVMLLLAAFGCSKSGAELIGIWDNTKAPEIVEFKADGSGVFTYPKTQNPPLTFTWEQDTAHKYILDINFMGTKKTLTAVTSDKGLSIESTTGKELYQKHISH